MSAVNMAQSTQNWDEQENDEVNSTTGALTKLNINAPEFTPSFARNGDSSEASISMITSRPNGVNKWESVGENSTNITTRSVTRKEKQTSVAKHDLPSRKDPINIIFCGHVDAGKSTICGQLMFLTGHVDPRILERYKMEAREKSRESWHFAWVTDTNEEERDKGKTVEVGRAWFETEKKHFTILDAPGHKCFIPNMITGATQADIAILVISARQDEFETGFERAGQTREHAMLLKTVGVRYLIVLINKMDDLSVQWSRTRYEEIQEKLKPFLTRTGFKSEDTVFIPCSGMTGTGLKEHPGETILPWYTGPTFIEYLDDLPSFQRNVDGPFRMSIVDRYQDMGLIVMGKIESGFCHVGDRCIIMPNRTATEIVNIYFGKSETNSAICGENVRIKLKNVDEECISPGFVLCNAQQDLCSVGRSFAAQIVLVDVKNIISVGYAPVLHIHSCAVDVQIERLISLIDRKSGVRTERNPHFLRQDQIATVQLTLSQPGRIICVEQFQSFPQFGRFTLRDEGRTAAFGKILKILQ